MIFIIDLASEPFLDYEFGQQNIKKQQMPQMPKTQKDYFF